MYQTVRWVKPYHMLRNWAAAASWLLLLSKSHQQAQTSREKSSSTLHPLVRSLPHGIIDARTPECLNTRCARYANHCESFRFCINSTSFIMIFMITDRINTDTHIRVCTYIHIPEAQPLASYRRPTYLPTYLPTVALLCSCHKERSLNYDSSWPGWHCGDILWLHHTDRTDHTDLRAEYDPVIIGWYDEMCFAIILLLLSYINSLLIMRAWKCTRTYTYILTYIHIICKWVSVSVLYIQTYTYVEITKITIINLLLLWHFEFGVCAVFDCLIWVLMKFLVFVRSWIFC